MSLKNTKLSTITRGASLYIVGKAVVDLLEFVLNIILTRALGASLYGAFALGQTIFLILRKFTNVGSDQALLKYLPQYRDDPTKQQFVLALATGTSIVASVVVAVLLYYFAPFIASETIDDPTFVNVLRLFCLVLVFDTVSLVLYSTFRSLERLEYEIVTNRLFRPTVRVAAVVVALGLGASLVGVMAALVVSSVLSLGAAVYVLLAKFELRPKLSREEATGADVFEYYNLSVPVTFKNVGSLMISRVDVLMVGFLLSSTSVGIYNVAVLLAGVLALPLSAFNQLFPPIASQLYSDGDVGELNSLYKTVTRWTFTISLLMALGLVVYRYELLTLFGEEFTVGATVLTLFVVGQLFQCAGGANGYLLMMTERQYVLMANQWAFGLLNVLLNYLLILQYGFIGAAVATATVFALMNLTKTLELWYLEGLFPYSSTYLKPLGAGLVAATVMVVVGGVFGGLGALVVGGGAGVAAYLLSLYLMGIEEEDREFFDDAVMSKL